VSLQSSLTMDGLELSHWLAVTSTQPGEAVMTSTALNNVPRRAARRSVVHTLPAATPTLVIASHRLARTGHR
jgi:hypothetical protein